MTATVVDAVAPRAARGGGIAARRAVIRWAWRLFRHEWRQQLLVLGLIVAAVAATFIGTAVATNTQLPANAGFGSAHDRVILDGSDPHLATEIATLHHEFAPVDIIEEQTLRLPGSVDTYDLRAEDMHGRYASPMNLLAGHFPTRAGQVAMTKSLATAFHVGLGGVWHQANRTFTVVGYVRDPENLLSVFALVAPGQVTAPTQVTMLFDAPPGASPNALKGVQVASSKRWANPLNPETLAIVAAVLGMLLIALVSIGGFTVLAQRRLRSLGMLASLGATDRNIALVVLANGTVTGIVGAVIGTALGLLGWLAYRPHLETSVHHVIGTFALPWLVIGLSFALAVVATYVAALFPARAVTKIPIVTALSGRPGTPRQIHRSAVPGIAFLAVAFVLLGIAGSTAPGHASSRALPLILGLVALIPGVILLAPFCLSTLARCAGRTPIAVRLALRDLSRYRARSGSALSAIAVGLLIAVITVIVASIRYGNALDYAGPNLASNQLVVYTPYGPLYAPPPYAAKTGTVNVSALQRAADGIGSSLGGSTVITLESTSASLDHPGPGRNWNGPIYVATPALLHAFGITTSQVHPGAQILTARPGLSSLSGLQLTYGSCPGQQLRPGPDGHPVGQAPPPSTQPCKASSGTIHNPAIQEIDGLPSGTSAPNTVITTAEVQRLRLPTQVSGWLIQAPQNLTAAQVSAAKLAAANFGLSVESKNDEPSASEVINVATGFGIGLALAILAMTVGLIRSETASDLRTLTATGASSQTRRTLTAATAGGLALLGALLGTVTGYVAVIGLIRDNSLNGGVSALGNVPWRNLGLIVFGMPAAATVLGWLLAGREPAAIAHQPLD